MLGRARKLIIGGMQMSAQLPILTKLSNVIIVRITMIEGIPTIPPLSQYGTRFKIIP